MFDKKFIMFDRSIMNPYLALSEHKTFVYIRTIQIPVSSIRLVVKLGHPIANHFKAV